MKTNIVAGGPAAPNLSEKQKLALSSDRSVSVRAGAGSGKTRTIIEKIFELLTGDYKAKPQGAVLDKDKNPETSSGKEFDILNNILCISFTNKAASELRERITDKINGEIIKTSDSDYKNYLNGISQRIGSLEICTLDSFFTSILKRHAFASGLPSGFTPAPGGRTGIIFRKAVFNVLDAFSNDTEIITGGMNNIFEDFYSFYRKKDRIHRLFSHILAKAVYLKKPLFNHGSLSDFESSIHKRMGSIDSAVKNLELSALMIFGDAQKAMEFLRAESPSMAETSKNKAEGLLQRYARIEENTPKNAIGDIEEFFKYLASDFTNVRFSKDTSKAGIENFNQIMDIFKKTAKKFFGAKNAGGDCDKIKLTRAEFDFFKGLCEIFDLCRSEYERLKTEESLLDFNDIEELALSLLDNQSVCTTIKNQYRHILIDEFQDTNNLQASIIEKIKGRASLTIVGDGMQSIYRFRNANCSLFSKFERDIASQGGDNVNLDDNYRCSENILKFINDFFLSLNLNISHPFSDFCYTPLNALSQKAVNKGIAVEAGLFPTIIDKCKKNCAAEELDDFDAGVSPADAVSYSGDDGRADSPDDGFDAGQFDFIARRVVLLKKEEGYRYGDMMVLLSRMSNIDSLARALRAEDVPFVITKSRKFYQRPEIIDIYNLVKTLVNPYDDISMCGLLRSPIFSVPDYIIFAVKESFRIACGGGEELRDCRRGAKFSARHSNKTRKDLCIYSALGALSRGELEFEELLADSAQRSSHYKFEKERLINIYGKINEYIDLCEHSSAYDILSAIYLDLDLECRYSYAGDFGAAYKNIEKLLAHIHENSYLPDSSIHEFIENFQSVVDIGFSEEESQDGIISDAVKIMTVHQAKGLEEKVVFIPEIEADFFKAMDSDIMVNAEGDLAFHPGAFIRLNEKSMLKNYYDSVNKYEKIQELFEKKRLLYVAATRACEKLIFSGSFKININKKGEAKSSKLKKQPFIFSDSQLNWIINYLNLDVDFFINELESGEPKSLSGAFGKILLYVKPPRSQKINEEINKGENKKNEIFGDKKLPGILNGAQHASWPETECGRKINYNFNIFEKYKILNESGCRENIDAAAKNHGIEVINFKPGLSYSDYKKFASLKNRREAGEAPEPATAASGGPQYFNERLQLLNKSLNSIENSPASLAGTAFHKAVEIMISSGHTSDDLMKFSDNICKIACRAADSTPAGPALRPRVKKMIGSFIKNIDKCGLKDLFTDASRQLLKKYCELKLYYESRDYLLEGVCDLITIDACGNATIYDFKTINGESPEKMADYETQAAFYQLCAEKSLAGISDFNPPVIILVENGGECRIKAVEIPRETIKARQAEIINNINC